MEYLITQFYKSIEFSVYQLILTDGKITLGNITESHHENLNLLWRADVFFEGL